ncbi:MAG: hypothetical protein AAF206_20600 [Bacteroidota bacterium]
MQRYMYALLAGFVCFSGGVLTYIEGVSSWASYILMALAIAFFFYGGLIRSRQSKEEKN